MSVSLYKASCPRPRRPGVSCRIRRARRFRNPALLAVLFLWLPLLCASGGLSLSSAAEPALPKAEQILDNMIRAQGGGAAYAAQQNRVTYGSMELRPMGIKLAVIEYAARPNRNYVLATAAQLGKIESGFSGDVAWESSAIQGPRIKEGSENADARREADFDGLLHWRTLYAGVTCTGVDTLDGRPCYRVIMIPETGSPDTSFFAVETGLLVQSRTVIDSEMGKVSVATYVDDYRKVGDLLWPFRTRQVMMGGLQEMILTTDSIRVNVELPADRFDPPAEVKALMEKRTAGEGKQNGGEGKQTADSLRTEGKPDPAEASPASKTGK
jgi:hypothetical protein